jgi:hypothetical protein
MLAKDAAQRWTLEQCVASPAFSDELLLKLRKACPELAPHLEHFMVGRRCAAGWAGLGWARNVAVLRLACALMVMVRSRGDQLAASAVLACPNAL